MKFLQYVHYLYLILAAMFIWRGIEQYQSGENAIPTFIFAGLAIFLFFFRRKFSNQMKNNNK